MIDLKKLATTEFYNHRYRNFSTLIILPTAVLFLLLLLFLVFAKREVTVRTVAEIAPVKAAVKIQGTAANRIVTNHMKEGRRVRRGDTLLVYHDVANPAQLKVLTQQLATLKDQKAQLETLNQSVTANKDLFKSADKYGYQQQVRDYLNQRRVFELESDVVHATQSVADAKNKEIDQLLRTSMQASEAKIAAIRDAQQAIRTDQPLKADHVYHYLYVQYQAEVKNMDAANLASLKGQYQSQLQNLLATEKETLASLNTQRANQKQADVSAQQTGQNEAKLASLQSELQQTIAAEQVKIQQGIQEGEAKLTALKDGRQQYQVKAPASGVLHLEAALSGNKYIPTGTVLAQILPDLAKQQEADLKLAVSPAEVMSLKRGQTVRLRIARNVPTPMAVTGRIYAVDVAPTVNPKTGNFFKAQARVHLSKAQRRSLYYGIGGEASVITGTKTYWQYFADKMFNRQ
ncbi:bacteriocin secretion accessory protein [Lacticaseibacillus chiayiensis]|uniref:bacteriocin secretion accessory protein n=1 Tax=Lacticaseibacillus chiayiensis TaxID=2100821 RepID=UPI0010118AF2|nr:bacteriocin secretion accessory protein [Lacticaseibacillus chiayiensis]RXT57938.1 bacteriocin ABC transporter permease [Lacticaseibacillus chiayiensis]